MRLKSVDEVVCLIQKTKITGGITISLKAALSLALDRCGGTTISPLLKAHATHLIRSRAKGYDAMSLISFLDTTTTTTDDDDGNTQPPKGSLPLGISSAVEWLDALMLPGVPGEANLVSDS